MRQRSEFAVSKVAIIRFEGKRMTTSVVATIVQPESILASTKAQHGTCTCNRLVFHTSILIQYIHQV